MQPEINEEMFSAAMNSGSCSQKESPPESATPPAETSPDLVAGALARRDVVSGATRLDYWKARELKDSPVAMTRSCSLISTA